VRLMLLILVGIPLVSRLGRRDGNNCIDKCFCRCRIRYFVVRRDLKRWR
jgi:hypothetical protein